MHDGYLFILGLCGTASGTSLAPTLLSAMLKTVPPVKRAALLGEVTLLDDWRSTDDHLLLAAIDDMADAELLLLVTPARTHGLPLRFQQLLRQSSQTLGKRLAGRYAVLAVIAEGGDPAAALTELGEYAEHVGLVVAERLCIGADLSEAEALALGNAAALRAYRAARTLAPHALPQPFE